MSNVIAFLESMGRNAAFAPNAAEMAAVVAELPLDDAARSALLAGDSTALNDLLGGRLKMMCLLFPADGGDEQKENDDQPADDDSEEKKEKVGTGRH